jgi:hypothetical protein
MRHSSSVTTVSWIPSEAITGAVLKMPFDTGMAQYDAPPPDTITDLAAFVADGRCRFANVLEASIDVDDGVIVGYEQSGGGHVGATTLRVAHRALTFAALALPDRRSARRIGDTAVRFEQTAGGRTGVPAPRRVAHPPYLQLSAPLAWTTLALTLHADGRSEWELVGASPFPRHWIYHPAGQLHSKSSTIDYHTWSVRAFGRHTPWGDQDSAALVNVVESAVERQLSAQIMGGAVDVRRLPAGAILTEQGAPADELYLLLDGVLRVEVDGAAVADIGPGAILGERAVLEDGRRTATLRAVSPCTVAATDPATVDGDALMQVAGGHRREETGG